jgi:hypothetical protein
VSTSLNDSSLLPVFCFLPVSLFLCHGTAFFALNSQHLPTGRWTIQNTLFVTLTRSVLCPSFVFSLCPLTSPSLARCSHVGSTHDGLFALLCSTLATSLFNANSLIGSRFSSYSRIISRFSFDHYCGRSAVLWVRRFRLHLTARYYPLSGTSAPLFLFLGSDSWYHLTL